MQTVWINGVVCGEKEAHISPFDHGFTVGDGVFETVCAYSGKVFALRRHWERMARGAAVMGIRIPDCETLRTAAEEIVRANGLSQARVRITATGGPSPLGSEKGSAGSTVVIAAAATPRWDATASVATVPYPRNERGVLAGLKTTSYGENVLALNDAKKRGASEAIFGNTRGELCEGTGSNIFVVREGEVLTPPLDAGCLAGVTRALVVELAREAGVPLREAFIRMEELPSFEEAFLTSTTREVQPIRSIDGRWLSRAPGEATTTLAAAYRRLVAERMDP